MGRTVDLRRKFPRAPARHTITLLAASLLVASCTSKEGPTQIQTEALSIMTATLPPGASNVSYTQSLIATGGTGGYTWSLASGSPPSGLSLSAGGTISGTPTTPGTVNFTVQVESGDNQTDTQALSITISADLVITTTTLPSGILDIAYGTQFLSATGGVGPYTWSMSAGQMAPGLNLDSDGSISGTPTEEGTYNFTARVESADNQVDTQALSLTITPNAAPTISNFEYLWVSDVCGIANTDRIQYTVDYTDPDGDNGPGITRVFVQINQQTPYESADGFNNYNGTGFNGSVTADNCLGGAATISIWILDGAGNQSNTLVRAIPSSGF